MSDIPLRELRKIRAENAGISLSAPASMSSRPMVPQRKRLYKSGKKNDRYADDSEEEQGLLQSSSASYEDEFQQGSSTSPVCRNSPVMRALNFYSACTSNNTKRQVAGHTIPSARYSELLSSPQKSLIPCFRQTAITIPTEHHTKSKIQRFHVPAYRLLRAIQILL